jgi:hypothetical protein
MLGFICLIVAVLFGHTGAASTTALPDEFHEQVYRTVLSAGRSGGFEEMTLSGPTTLLRTTTQEGYRRIRMDDMPPHFAEALENLYATEELLDLSALADERTLVRDTLDGTWQTCNAILSPIGWNSASDAAALLLTYGCQSGDSVAGASFLVFVSKEESDWRVSYYLPLGSKRHSPAISRLQVFFAREPWGVPQEARRLAEESRRFGFLRESFAEKEDPIADNMDRIEWGTPYAWYKMPDSVFETFSTARDPDPQDYAVIYTYYVFPFFLDGEPHGTISIRYGKSTGYSSAMRSIGRHFKLCDPERLRRHPKVSQLLGLVSSSGDHKGWWWAYRDSSGAFVLEEAAVNADNAQRSDFVVIGTLQNRRPRAICVQQYPDSITGRDGYTDYYDVADIEVEKVLKGHYSSARLRVCFRSPPPPGVRSQYHVTPMDVGNGDRRIWLLNRSCDFVSPYLVKGPLFVMSVDHLEAVMEFISEPAPKMVHCPMTRGAAWNADLTGSKGQTVFFILGMLSEYLGRRIMEDYDLVEHFYCNEKAVATVFRKYLNQLNNEQRLNAEISKKIKQECLMDFHSDVLSRFVNSFYDYTLTTPGKIKIDGVWKPNVSARPHLTKDVFEGLERDMVFAYLAGAYFRYGRGNSFRFANAYKKTLLVEELLKEVGCKIDRSSSGQTIPVSHSLTFEPTEELKTWFEKMP